MKNGQSLKACLSSYFVLLLLVVGPNAGSAAIQVQLTSSSPTPALAGATFLASLTISGTRQYEYTYSVSAALSGPGGGSYTGSSDSYGGTYSVSTDANSRGDITLTVTVTGTPIPNSGATGSDNGTASITFTTCDIVSMTPTAEYALNGTVLSFSATTDPVGTVPEAVIWSTSGGGAVAGNGLTGVFTANESIWGAGSVTITCFGTAANTATVQEIVTTYVQPGATEEGTMDGQFVINVTPEPAGITYSWQWSVPAATEAGDRNGPSVVFASPGTKTTGLGAKAHWYAVTPSQWSDVDGPVCSYDISCKVGYKSGENVPSGNWNVALQFIGGKTTVPYSAGTPTAAEREVDGVTQHYFLDVGCLAQLDPAVTIFIPTTSEFYSKIVAHENVHVAQLSAAPYSTITSVENVWGYVQNMTANSYASLIDAFGDYQDAKNAELETLVSANSAELEGPAYAVSNATAPLFLNMR